MASKLLLSMSMVLYLLSCPLLAMEKPDDKGGGTVKPSVATVASSLSRAPTSASAVVVAADTPSRALSSTSVHAPVSASAPVSAAAASQLTLHPEWSLPEANFEGYLGVSRDRALLFRTTIEARLLYGQTIQTDLLRILPTVLKEKSINLVPTPMAYALPTPIDIVLSYAVPTPASVFYQCGLRSMDIEFFGLEAPVCKRGRGVFVSAEDEQCFSTLTNVWTYVAGACFEAAAEKGDRCAASWIVCQGRGITKNYSFKYDQWVTTAGDLCPRVQGAFYKKKGDQQRLQNVQQQSKRQVDKYGAKWDWDWDCVWREQGAAVEDEDQFQNWLKTRQAVAGTATAAAAAAEAAPASQPYPSAAVIAAAAAAPAAPAPTGAVVAAAPASAPVPAPASDAGAKR